MKVKNRGKVNYFDNLFQRNKIVNVVFITCNIYSKLESEFKSELIPFIGNFIYRGNGPKIKWY